MVSKNMSKRLQHRLPESGFFRFKDRGGRGRGGGGGEGERGDGERGAGERGGGGGGGGGNLPQTLILVQRSLSQCALAISPEVRRGRFSAHSACTTCREGVFWGPWFWVSALPALVVS